MDGSVELPMMIGVLYGAVTNTPGLGAAQEALNQLGYTGDQGVPGERKELPRMFAEEHQRRRHNHDVELYPADALPAPAGSLFSPFRRHAPGIPGIRL